MLTNNTKFPHNRIKDEIVNLVRQIASLDIRETGVYVLKGPERIYILYEEKVYMLLVYVESQTLEISSLTDAAYIEKTAYYDVYLLDCDVKEFEQRAIAGFPYRTNLQMSVTHVGPIIYSRDADLTNMLYKLYNLGALNVCKKPITPAPPPIKNTNKKYLLEYNKKEQQLYYIDEHSSGPFDSFGF